MLYDHINSPSNPHQLFKHGPNWSNFTAIVPSTDQAIFKGFAFHTKERRRSRSKFREIFIVYEHPHNNKNLSPLFFSVKQSHSWKVPTHIQSRAHNFFLRTKNRCESWKSKMAEELQDKDAPNEEAMDVAVDIERKIHNAMRSRISHFKEQAE